MPFMRLAELLGRLSLASDIANDFPHGKSVRSVVLAVELGRAAGESTDDTRDAFWVTLLGFLGCTGFAHEEAQVGAGDDQSVRNAMVMADVADPLGTVMGAIRRIGRGAPFMQRIRAIASILTDREGAARYARAMCDSSIHLARIVGAGPQILTALETLCERWDGRGAPAQIGGEGLTTAMRLNHIGHIVELAHHRGGRDAALAVVKRRSGGQFDPRLARAFVAEQRQLFEAIEDPLIFDRFLALEPEPVAQADESRIDDVARALGHFADLKSPSFLGHSAAVADLAASAAEIAGLGANEIRVVRRAALFHDLGRVSVPNGIWESPGKLDWGQWERVRLHAYYTERVLAPLKELADVRLIAGMAHERCDGSGYHRGVAGDASVAANILAASDIATAMGEARPHRAALPTSEITSHILAEASAGRLDRKVADAVLQAMGTAERAPPSPSPQLTERELEVARLVARGNTNRGIGAELGISARTVQIHVAHIYKKIGVSSRAGAAVWLMENELLRERYEWK